MNFGEKYLTEWIELNQFFFSTLTLITCFVLCVPAMSAKNTLLTNPDWFI